MERRSFVLPPVLFLAGCRSARRELRPAVRIAVAGRGALEYLPVYLASALGFFRDAGMQVEIQDLGSSPQALHALLGGSADVVAAGYESAVQLAIDGKSIEAIAVLERWPPYALVVATQFAESVRTIADLKGHMVGVTSPGSGTHRFLNYLLGRNGLSPSDITPVGVGANFSMAAAVQHGKVAAAVAGPLGVALLSKQSLPRLLTDCRTQQGAESTLGTNKLPSSSLMVGAQWARSNRAILREVANATRRTLTWIQEHSPEDISRSIPSEYKGEDAGLYLSAVAAVRPTFSVDGIMTPEGPANVQRFLGASDERVRTATVDLSKTFTNEFVQSR